MVNLFFYIVDLVIFTNMLRFEKGIVFFEVLFLSNN
jgi:hypothetical protein